MPPAVDRTGQIFGCWRVLRLAKHQHGNKRWWCLCDPELGGCGNKESVQGCNLVTGASTNCGCVHTNSLITHGGTGTSTHSSWKHAKLRTYNRGITMCKRWKIDFSAFRKELGERPKGMTLDRKDNEGNYSCGKCKQCRKNGWPMNCRWATPKQQARNRRDNHQVTINGITKCLTEWCIQAKITPQRVYRRIDSGWSYRKAIFTS